MKKALLVSWDNFPNIPMGGVYTWARTLVTSMPDWDFILLSQLSNANTNAKYTIPNNVSQVIELPMYGTTRFEEFCNTSKNHYEKIVRTSSEIIREKFVPLFSDLLTNLLSDDSEPKKLASQFYDMHKFFEVYDWKKCLEHQLTLETFLDFLRSDSVYNSLRISEALAPFRMIQRGLQILAIDIPNVAVVHCSSAWLPSLIAVCAKLQNGSAIIITEHGIAFKELNLYINSTLKTTSSRLLWKIFSRNIVRALYSISDSIISVSAANTLWQISLGADQSKIKVVHNGVDTRKFRPISESDARVKFHINNDLDRPIVVSVGRVDFFKDIVCLVGAIKFVSEYVPKVVCLQFGEASNLEYAQSCFAAVRDLGMENNFRFMGGTSEPEKAYNIGDVVAMSSITEGFPYSVIEAMACGKAVVAADVGGVREALGDCGILVKSRSTSELGKGIIRVLTDHDLRKKLEHASLRRARENFALEECIDRYRKEYTRLSEPGQKVPEIPERLASLGNAVA